MQEDIDPASTTSVLRPKTSDCKVTAEAMQASWEQVGLSERFKD